MNILLKPWVLVTAGIVFNIFSAVITHYFIDINNQKIHLLESRIQQLDGLIENEWRKKTEIDRKEEFLLLMLNQSKGKNSINSAEQQLITRQLNNLLKYQFNHTLSEVKPPVKDFQTIISVTSNVKKALIDSINTNYLERLELDSQRQPVIEKNSLLSSLAIFLQLSGLILVLSKDINA